MKTALSAENKVTFGDDFPRLKLDHNERALVVCIEKEPEMEFVHTIRKPIIGDDGKAVYEERKGKGGKTFKSMMKEFVGQHRCFGRAEILLGSTGYDPEQCPTCKASDEEEGIDKPERRYAMHVLQYACQPGKFAPQKPLSMKTVVWTFAQSRFNELTDLKETWQDLRAHDLQLGPCENKDFQKYNLNMVPTSAWRETPETKAYAAEVYKNSRCPDLSALIGRVVTRSQALEDIQAVASRYAELHGGPAAIPTGDTAGLQEDVAGILDGIDDEGASSPAASDDLGDLDDAFDKSAPIGDAEKTKAEPAADEAPDDLSSIADTPAATNTDDVPELDAFLADLAD